VLACSQIIIPFSFRKDVSDFVKMPVESTLCRVLNIRFIDARGLVTEAKLNMGILGYHDETLEESLVAEATRLYEELDDDRKDELRLLKSELDGIKIQETGGC
jgi:hypothetical protein